jgi:glutathione-independent formaldehyde dehydrogenase
MFDGRTGAEPGLVFGHEPLGVVDEVGAAVTMVSVGDRVVIPTHLYCGMGGYRGGQAELLRVPFADANCIPVPGEPGDDHEDDFVLLADALVTGWHATELAQIGPAPGPVAVFGAGAVGLLAAYSALLKGAGEVYVVDAVDAGLDKAGELGATPVDFRAGDPVEQIREQRRAHGLPLGETGMDGVQHAIDAVGFQARDREHPDVEAPTQVIDDIAQLVNPTGHVGIAGVYAEKDLHPAPEGNPDGSLTVPWATLFAKGMTVGFGRTPDRRYTIQLRDLVVSGRAHPGRIVTHHGPLIEAPALFDAFDRREQGVIKAVLHP